MGIEAEAEGADGSCSLERCSIVPPELSQGPSVVPAQRTYTSARASSQRPPSTPLQLDPQGIPAAKQPPISFRAYHPIQSNIPHLPSPIPHPHPPLIRLPKAQSKALILSYVSFPLPRCGYEHEFVNPVTDQNVVGCACDVRELRTDGWLAFQKTVDRGLLAGEGAEWCGMLGGRGDGICTGGGGNGWIRRG